MNYIEEFYEYVEKNGAEGLLPQNLKDSILNRMLKGIEDYENDDDNAQVVTIVLAIYSIKNGGKIEKNLKMLSNIGEEFIEEFENYVACLKIEGVRRSTPLAMLSASLPTLKNIFDKDRKVYISRQD